MKAGEIRGWSTDERGRKLTDLKQELFNLRFQHAVGQLENPKKMMQIKRDIARIGTIMREETLKRNAGKE
jgi:large subunit ribosomal protein L29